MDITKMIEEFGFRYTSEINLSVPGWEEDEILSFLNNAQRDVTDELYGEVGEPALQELVRQLGSTNVSPAPLDSYSMKNVKYFEQQGFIWRFLLSIHIEVTRTDITVDAGLPIKAEYIDPSIIGSLLETPFNKPIFRELYYFITNENLDYTISPQNSDEVIAIVHDAYTTLDASTMVVRFIKEPDTLVTGTPGANETNTCELHEKYHDMVVDRAVTLAIEALMNPRVATQPQITAS